MEAWQHVKLTGPNRSFGWIPCAWRQVRQAPDLIGNTGRSRQAPCPTARTAANRSAGGRSTRVAWAGRRRVRARSAPEPLRRPVASGVVRMAMFFDDLVVMARGEAPDPIPNSAVKTLSADGTASQGVGE